MVQGQEKTTVRDVADMALKHNADSWDPALPEDLRFEAASRLDQLRSAYAIWYASPDARLRDLAGKLDQAIDFSRARKTYGESGRALAGQAADTGLGEPSFYAGLPVEDRPDTISRELAAQYGVTPMDGVPNLVREDGSLVSEAIPARPWYSLGGGDAWEIEGDLAGQPVDLSDPVLRERFQQYFAPEDENGVIATERGEYPLYQFDRGNRVDIALPDGSYQHVEIDSDMLERFASAKQGGWIGMGWEGSVARRIFHGPDWKVNTPLGVFMVPNVTGNALTDKQLMEDPIFLRSYLKSEAGSGLLAFARGTTQVGTMMAGFAGTSYIGGLAVKAGKMAAAGAAARLGIGAGIATPTASAFARAAVAGGQAARSRQALPGLAFDLKQIGEQVWYEGFGWAVSGQEGPLGDRLRYGLEMGVAGAALGGGVRAARRGTAALLNHWDGFAKTRLGRAVTRFEGVTQDNLLQAGTDEAIAKVQGLRSRAAEEIRHHAQAFITQFARDRTSAERLVQLADSSVVMGLFGMYSGGQSLAAEEGKEWGSLSLGEKAGYLGKSLFMTPEPWAMMAGAAAWQGGVWSLTGRGGFDASDPKVKKLLNDQAQYVVDVLARQSPAELEGVSGAFDAAVAAMTPEQLDAFHMSKLGPRLGLDVSAGGVRLDKVNEAVNGLAEIAGRENNGDILVAQSLRGLKAGDLDALEARARSLAVERTGELGEVRVRPEMGRLLQALHDERLRRYTSTLAEGQAPEFEPPIDPKMAVGDLAVEQVEIPGPREVDQLFVGPQALAVEAIPGEPMDLPGAAPEPVYVDLFGRRYERSGNGVLVKQPPPKAPGKPTAKGPPKPKPGEIPFNEWQTRFSSFENVSNNGLSGRVTRLKGTSWAIVEAADSSGELHWIVTHKGKPTSRLAPFPHTANSLHAAMGSALVLSRQMKMHDHLRDWMAQPKAKARLLISPKDVDRLTKPEVRSQAKELTAAIAESVDADRVAKNHAERRMLGDFESQVSRQVESYKALEKKFGRAWLEAIGPRIQDPVKREAHDRLTKAVEPPMPFVENEGRRKEDLHADPLWEGLTPKEKDELLKLPDLREKAFRGADKIIAEQVAEDMKKGTYPGQPTPEDVMLMERAQAALKEAEKKAPGAERRAQYRERQAIATRDRKPTLEETAEAYQAIASALEVVPEYGGMTPTERVTTFLDPGDSTRVSALADKVTEAQALGQLAQAMRPPEASIVKIQRDALALTYEARNIQSGGRVSYLWSRPDLRAAYQSGIEFFSVRSKDALGTALTTVFAERTRMAEAVARAQADPAKAGEALAEAATAKDRIHALVAGLLVATGLPEQSNAERGVRAAKPGPKLIEFIAAVAGYSGDHGVQEVLRIRRDLMNIDAPHQQERMDRLNAEIQKPDGSPLFTEGQLQRGDTMSLLSVLTAIPLETVRESFGAMPSRKFLGSLMTWYQRGPERGRQVGGKGEPNEAVSQAGKIMLRLAALGEKAAGYGEMSPQERRVVSQAIDQHFLAYLQKIRDAAPSHRDPDKGLSKVGDMRNSLMRRLSYSLTGRSDLGPDTKVPVKVGGEAKELTLSQLADEVLSRLSTDAPEQVTRQIAARSETDIPGDVAIAESVAAPTGDAWGEGAAQEVERYKLVSQRFDVAARGLGIQGETANQSVEIAQVLRAVAVGSGPVYEAVLANAQKRWQGDPGAFEQSWVVTRQAAKDTLAYMEDAVVRHYAAVLGEKGGRIKDPAPVMRDFFEALNLTSQNQKIPPDLAERLSGKDVIEMLGRPAVVEVRGRLAIDPGLRFQMARDLFDAMSYAAMASETADMGTTKIVPLYGGISAPMWDKAWTAAVGTLDFLSGYMPDLVWRRARQRGRAFDPSKPGLLSLQKATGGRLSISRWVDRIQMVDPFWQTPAGNGIKSKLVEPFIQWWTGHLARPSSSLYPRLFEGSKKTLRRARIGSLAEAEMVAESMDSVAQHIRSLNLDPFERDLVGKAIHGKTLRRMSKEEWTKVYGERRSHLYDVAQDIAHIFAKTGERLWELGVIDKAAFEALVQQYLPRIRVDLRPDADGKIRRARTRVEIATGSSAFPRVSNAAVEGVVDIYDIAYVMPLGVAQQSKMVRLYGTLQAIADDPNAIIDESQLDKLSPFQRLYLKKVAEPTFGENAGELLAEEAKLTVAEQQAIIERRRKGVVDSAIVYEWVKREREVRAREGGPPLTARMEELFRRLESGYTTRDILGELAMLITSAQPHQGEFTAAWADQINAASRVWREMRTYQNPSFWVMNNTTSTVTNHATGRLSMFDWLNPNGYYRRSSRALAAWWEWHKGGRGEETYSEDIGLVETYLNWTGRNTFFHSIQGEWNPADIMRSYFDVIGPMRGDVPLGHQSLQRIIEGVAASGVNHREMAQRLFKLRGDPNPLVRAEALTELMAVQQLHEVMFKMAPWIRAVEMGMDPKDAVEWAAKGSGDYEDRNPWLYRLTTNFTSSISELEAKAHQRGRRSLRGESPPKGLTLSQKMARTMLGSPFWLYRASMYPELGKAMVDSSWKVAAAYGLTGMGIAAISAAFGGDMRKLMMAFSGHEDLLYAGLKPEDVEDWLKRNGDKPVPWFGGQLRAQLVPTMRDYMGFFKDWSTWPMGFKARGPSFGGESFFLDFSDHMLVPSGLAHAAARGPAMLAGTNDYKEWHATGIADEIGIGFLPVMATAGLLNAIGLAEGKRAESRWETATRVTLDAVSEVSAPLSGFLSSTHGQRMARNLFWDGRSLHEIIHSLPASRLAGGTGDVVGQTLMGLAAPMRPVPRGETRRPGGGFMEWLGLHVPYQRGSEDAEEVGVQIRRRNVRVAVQNLFSQAYKEAQSSYTPLPAIYARMFDLSKDIVFDPLGNAVDVREAPETELGQFIRAQSKTREGRAEYLDSTLRSLHLHRQSIESLISGPEGLASRIDVDPAVHDRIVRAVWNHAESPASLVDFLHEAAVRQPGWAKGHDALWYRMFFNAGLNRAQIDPESPAYAKLTALAKWVREHSTDAHPMYDVREGLRVLGGRMIDVMPGDFVEALPRVPGRGDRRPLVLPHLLGQ